METNSEIFLYNDKGEKKKYTIIASFTDEEDNNFVVYTDGTLDEDNFLRTYAGIVDPKDNNRLLPLKDDKQWALVEDLLSRIDVGNE